MIVGADTGGTFTDFVAVRDGVVRATFKTPSTPTDYSEAVDAGVARLGATELVHASTVATNALIERRGAATALITTEGFRDVLALGRQERPSLYDLSARPSEPLVPRHLCFEVRERIGADGSVVVPLADDEIDRVAAEVTESGARSAAVCLLFSFLDPRHEERIGRELGRRGIAVSLSSVISPEFREYERASTTAANAFVGPVVQTYLERVRERAAARGTTDVRVVLSNGASREPEGAASRAIETALSGPAAGVVGAHAAARDALGSEPHAISLDMGGTSTDVALIRGRPATAPTTTIAGLPLQIPVVDIHTVGAGGGSVARVDVAGALRAGPDSAGADPGPAAYGRGGPATVTDANLVLGRLVSDRFLGGRLGLDEEAARRSLEPIANEIGATLETAAEGVITVVNAEMERSLRVISIERGHDPRDFALVAFGGAGGLHACALADSLGIGTVIVPREPGVLSALGAATGEIAFDLARTVMVPLADRVAIDHEFESLAAASMNEDRGAAMALDRRIDARYRGQSYELTIPWRNEVRDVMNEFHRAHEERYGFQTEDAEIEIVTLRLRRVVRDVAPAEHIVEGRSTTEGATVGESRSGPVIDRDALACQATVMGPAVIVERYATTWLPPGWRGVVEAHGHLVLEPEA